MKTIELIIDPTGNVKAETKGFSGPDCKQASAFIESALGKVTSEARTAAYYANGSASSQVNNEN